LMGSNSQFLKETTSMVTWLDVEHLYLSRKDSGRALSFFRLYRLAHAHNQRTTPVTSSIDLSETGLVSYRITAQTSQS
jgi:hypothetical protein